VSIRDSKTIDTVEYTYFLEGSNIIYETDYTSGTSVVEYRYDAFGSITYQTGSSLASANPYRYDQETGYYYLESRYYNPETGRFINADGLLTASNTVLGNNMYAYTENNPVMGRDYNGLSYCFASAADYYDGPSCMGGSSSGGGWGHQVDEYSKIELVYDIIAMMLYEAINNISLRSLVSTNMWDLSAFKIGIGTAKDLQGFECTSSGCVPVSIDSISHIGPIYSVFNDTDNGYESETGISFLFGYVGINQDQEIVFGSSFSLSFGFGGGFNHRIHFDKKLSIKMF